MREFASRGKTVVFATHYLEEADAYADRIVLMAHGAVVADGPPTEIKAMVGTRTIRATLPGVPLEGLERLPGVASAVLYFLIAGPNRNEGDIGGSGLSAPLYFMVSLAAFGTMNAMLGSGARIAGERSVGWNRQLRITPLPVRTYFRTKVLTGYFMVVLSLVTLYAAGASLGVSMSGQDRVEMTAFILVGLVPFAALGICLGRFVTPDSVGPVVGGATALFALLGDTWFPITGGVMQRIGEALPSYWLVQAGHVGLGGDRGAGSGGRSSPPGRSAGSCWHAGPTRATPSASRARRGHIPTGT